MFRTRTEWPPMPWVNYHDLAGQDLQAEYRFIKGLGPKGTAAPACLPPGQEPTTPYIPFVPPDAWSVEPH